jgi:hypothetical protein
MPLLPKALTMWERSWHTCFGIAPYSSRPIRAHVAAQALHLFGQLRTTAGPSLPHTEHVHKPSPGCACMCVCVCMHVCMHECMYVCMNVWNMCMLVWVCMQLCMHVPACLYCSRKPTCMYECVYSYHDACSYVCMYAAMYACTCMLVLCPNVHMYVCMYAAWCPQVCVCSGECAQVYVYFVKLNLFWCVCLCERECNGVCM